MSRKVMAGLLIALVAGITGCGGGSSSSTIPTNQQVQKTTATIQGTVISLNALVAKQTSKTVASVIPDVQIANGNVRVMAVDANGNVSIGTTDANKHFSISVSTNKSYAILYMNSAGQFLGNQIFNSETRSINATDDIDLGDVSIVNNKATSSRDSALSGQTVLSTIATPATVPVLPASTATFSSGLYWPMNNGDLVVSKGTGSSTPGTIDNDWNIQTTTTVFDATLGKWVYVLWYYRYTSMNNGIPTSWVINEKNSWYFNASELVAWKKETSASNSALRNFAIPDFLEVMRTYSIGASSTLQVRELFNQRAIPGGLGTFDGYIQYVTETSGGNVQGKYVWNAKGIGDVLYSSNQDGTGVMGQVIYKKMGGSSTEYGTRPSWLTDAVISGLPTTW